MGKAEKTLERVMRGSSDQSIRFDDLCQLAESLGFACRVRGSHRIYTRDGVDEILNFQPLPGGGAKAYQVKQLRRLIEKYKLELGQ